MDNYLLSIRFTIFILFYYVIFMYGGVLFAKKQPYFNT